MTDQAQSNETSAPQGAATQPKKPKGNQLEGKKSETLSVKSAADIFKGSILGDTGSDADTSDEKKPKPSAKDTKKPAQDRKPKGQSENEGDEADTDADETDDDTSDEDVDGQSEAEGDEAEEGDTSEDENSEDADDGEELHTVTVDGTELQITYEELLKGYERHANYTKKTEALSRERDDLQSQKEKIADLPKVKEAYQAGTERFVKNAELLLVAFDNGFMPPEPDEALRDTDPTAYILAKEKRQEAVQLFKGVQGEVAKVRHQAEIDHRKSVDEGRVKLLEIEPELQKPENRGQLQKYVTGLGFTEAQIRNEASPLLFQLAFKAMKWDNMMARAKNPNPAKPRPKVMSQTSARDDRDTVERKKRSETQANHKRNHSVKSASDVFAQRISASRKGK